MKRKELAQVENLLIESYSSFKKEFEMDDFHTKGIAQKSVTLYPKWNKKDKADFYLSTLQQFLKRNYTKELISN